MSKHDHRQKMKEKLSLIDENARTKLSSLLCKNLIQLFSELHVIQKRISIGAYAPFDREPIWNMGLSEDYQKLTSFPAYAKETKQMTFKLARMDELIVRKDFGTKIPGPGEDAPEIVPGLILVPGLAFTKKGERLGRGKGFYDRYLHQFNGIKIGICFSAQLEENFPTEKHDVILDYIVTEEKIINCRFA